MLKTITQQTPFLIKDKVLFQTEKIIKKLTGIPLGTIVFVMRKLYIIEVKGLGLGNCIALLGLFSTSLTCMEIDYFSCLINCSFSFVTFPFVFIAIVPIGIFTLFKSFCPIVIVSIFSFKLAASSAYGFSLNIEALKFFRS